MGSLFLPFSAFSVQVLLLCSRLTDLRDKLISYPLICFVASFRDPVLVDLIVSTPSFVFPNSRLLDFQGPSYLLEYLAFVSDYDGKLLTYKTIFISKSWCHVSRYLPAVSDWSLAAVYPQSDDVNSWLTSVPLMTLVASRFFRFWFFFIRTGGPPWFQLYG